MLPKTTSVSWSVLRKTLLHVKLTRCMCNGPTSFYKKTGSWPSLLNKDSMVEIENIWKDRIKVADSHSNVDIQPDQQKYYVLSMFPYPSGKLHMGHVRVYTISDMMARYHRMLGHHVVHPMGWDAFGLPAENAAIERNLHPKDWTYSNIATMREQLENLCCSFDWHTELATCDPSYYKWTQNLFVRLFEAGLAYQRLASVNWDPVDQTVLADEQIDEEGRSWRSGALVEKRYLRQWYIRTTAYAKSLMEGLDTVDSGLWRDIIQAQKHWIGECTGCRLDFKLQLPDGSFNDSLSIYTETPELIHGVSHVAIATNHRYNDPAYYKQIQEEGSEILLTLTAQHPVTGWPLPVVVSRMSEESMGPNDTWLGVPCQSVNDCQVADLHSIPWQPVLNGDSGGEVMVNSQQLNGLTRPEAAITVMEHAQKSKNGGHPVSSHLKDWLISRQRYWGTPIPVIHCPSCKAVPVPVSELPVMLPDSTQPSVGRGTSPLTENEDWINVTCPRCGGAAKRETDTMDTFVDSSWYFFRYLDHANQSAPVSRDKAARYMPVDLYIGGKEHAYLHLYYARFISHFLYDEGLNPYREPFVNLLTQGMVKGESYKVSRTGVYLRPEQVEQRDGKHFEKSTGEKVFVRYEKMSKSKHNGVDPEELFSQYGVDMTRLCILSNVAPKSDRNWNNEVYVGVQKWLNRVWSLVGVLVNSESTDPCTDRQTIDTWDLRIRTFRNNYLLEINYHLNKTFLFNTAISRMHELCSDLKKVPADVAVVSGEYTQSVMDMAVILAPFCPMFSSELWSAISQCSHGNNNTTYNTNAGVLEQSWPLPDSDMRVDMAVICNEVRIGLVPIPLSELEELDQTRALTLAQNQNFYSEIIQGLSPLSVRLTVTKGLKAQLHLNVPEVEVSKEKKKKKQKLTKSKSKQQKQHKGTQEENV